MLSFNDHYLKWTFSNWITGKLSDFTGLLIFPMFLKFLFPRLTMTLATLITGLFFVFWKLPLSDDFISVYNRVAFIPITRTVDYSDFVALTVLPFSYIAIRKIEHHRFQVSTKLPVNPIVLLIPSSFIFMATSPPLSYYMQAGGDVHIGKSYRMKISEAKILEKLKAEGFSIKKDTSAKFDRYYLIENVVIAEGKDTIKFIEFGFRGDTTKPLLLLNNITLTGDKDLSDWKKLKAYSKYYNKLIKSGIIDNLK